MDNILQKGNFHIKGWLLSGCADNINESFLIPEEWERVLGLIWVPSTDKFVFNVKINFSKKIEGVHSKPDILLENMLDELPTSLTKRRILSQVNGIFDPLGLVSPFIVKAKIYLRKLWTFEPKLDWDDTFPQLLHEEWVEFFKQALTLSGLNFKRCIKPHEAVGDPMLITFSDASVDAFGACAYFRWELTNELYESKLVISKTRVAPIKCMTIVNLELSAAVLAG